jgi:hypothetical protein
VGRNVAADGVRQRQKHDNKINLNERLAIFLPLNKKRSEIHLETLDAKRKSEIIISFNAA